MTDKYKAVLKYIEIKMKKKEFSRDDAVRIISYENRWIEPSAVDVFLKNSINLNLVKKIDENLYQINFDTTNIKIPIDLSITKDDLEKFSNSPKDAFKLLIERISENTGMRKEDVVAEVNRMRKNYPYFDIEILALFIAKERNVDVSDLYDIVEKSILE